MENVNRSVAGRKKKAPGGRPTDSEFMILQVLWQKGPCTVREVHEQLQSKWDSGYTTVLKLLQIMFAKGLVVRSEESKAHIYQAAVPVESSRHTVLSDLLEKLFDGSTKQLVMHAISTSKPSVEELSDIRKAIEELEQAD